MRITTRNARFQQLAALLTNRTKRQRSGTFLVQGVRPIRMAVAAGWPIRGLAYDGDRELSRWAADLLRETDAERIAMSGELIAELGEKDETAPEIVAVVALPADDPARVSVTENFLGVALDRPSGPGNIGSILRSADAFGASGVFITGHAADVYEPKSVRASTGSLFAVPAVRMDSPVDVDSWVARRRRDGVPIVIVGTDEGAEANVFDVDLTRPTLLVVGNETTGMSNAWRESCDEMVRIPMAGSASSLNAAASTTAMLYEIARQRIAASAGIRS